MCLLRERRTVSDFPAPPPHAWKTPLTVCRNGHAMRQLLCVNASPPGENSESRGSLRGRLSNPSDRSHPERMRLEEPGTRSVSFQGRAYRSTDGRGGCTRLGRQISSVLVRERDGVVGGRAGRHLYGSLRSGEVPAPPAIGAVKFAPVTMECRDQGAALDSHLRVACASDHAADLVVSDWLSGLDRRPTPILRKRLDRRQATRSLRGGVGVRSVRRVV